MHGSGSLFGDSASRFASIGCIQHAAMHLAPEKPRKWQHLDCCVVLEKCRNFYKVIGWILERVWLIIWGKPGICTVGRTLCSVCWNLAMCRV